jgi:RNA polymerase sigma-70 factor (sigma-E family)
MGFACHGRRGTPRLKTCPHGCRPRVPCASWRRILQSSLPGPGRDTAHGSMRHSDIIVARLTSDSRGNFSGQPGLSTSDACEPSTTSEGLALRPPSRRHAEFEVFVAASADRLVRTAFLLVGDTGDAEDLSQETLAKVARRWQRVRAMESPYGYARKILYHLALEEQARRRRGPDRSADLPVVAVGDGTEDFAVRDEVASAISALPPRQRATLVLRYWEDLSEADTAELLGCSAGTVKSQTSKALQHLRELLAASTSPPFVMTNQQRSHQ